MVLLPGACVEGALAVLLPWTVAQALLASPWLGAASAGLVAAATTGTLAAPMLERLLGNRSMTVVTGFVVAAALGVAVMCWVWAHDAAAYGFVLLAIAADAACDLGFASRTPLLARLSASKLETFSATNWLWSIGGAAAGSVLAGWAVAADRIVELGWCLVLLSLVVAVGLAVMLPRESRQRSARPSMLRALLQRGFWTTAAVKVAIVLAALVFFSGPLDNLLLPAHLALRSLPASTFGDILAALGLGLAVGMWWMQSGGSVPDAYLHHATRRDNTQRHKIVLGLLGLAGQLALMLWLPPQWVLLAGLFVCATMFAPLLPMLEAAMLTAAHPAQRTLMLSALSTLMGLADVLGTVSMGALMSRSSSTVALGLCLGVACVAALVCGVWSGRPRTRIDLTRS